MKTIYQCEKCGEMFKEYRDAIICEQKHFPVANGRSVSYQYKDYSRKHSFPNTIVASISDGETVEIATYALIDMETEKIENHTTDSNTMEASGTERKPLFRPTAIGEIQPVPNDSESTTGRGNTDL